VSISVSLGTQWNNLLIAPASATADNVVSLDLANALMRDQGVLPRLDINAVHLAGAQAFVAANKFQVRRAHNLGADTQAHAWALLAFWDHRMKLLAS
jgi:hypothetical protein